MKFDLKLPGGGEIHFERKPIDSQKFNTACKILSFGLYVSLTWVIASTDDFFALLWFYGLTVTVFGIQTYFGVQGKGD